MELEICAKYDTQLSSGDCLHNTTVASITCLPEYTHYDKYKQYRYIVNTYISLRSLKWCISSTS